MTKVFDVTALMAGTLEINTLVDCVATLATVAKVQTQARKTDESVFTRMFDTARATLGETLEAAKSKGSNESVADVAKIGAQLFKSQCEAAKLEAVKEFSLTEADLKLFSRYQSEIVSGILEGAPVLERDESGKWKLGGRSALVAWRKENRESKEREELRVAAEAGKHLGLVPPPGAQKISESKPEGSVEPTGKTNPLDLIKSAELRAQVEEWIVDLAQAEELDPEYVENFVAGQMTKVTKMLLHLKAQVKGAVLAQKKSA